MTAMGPPPSPERFPSFRSPSGKRMHPRLSLPACAEIAGQDYALRDWGLGGFALSEAGPRAAVGDPLRVRLRFGRGAVGLALDATATVLRAGNGRAEAFAFLDLSPEAGRTLDRLADNWLDPDASPAPILLDAPAKAPIPLPAPRVVTTRTLWTAGGLVAGLALLLLAGGYVVSQRLIVYSEFGAVAAPMRLVRAPAAGTLTALVATPGARVATGAPVATLVPVVPPQVRAELEPRIQAAEARLTRLEGEGTAARGAFDTYRARAEAALAAAVSSRAAADRAAASQERVYGRIAILARQGILSLVRMDQEEALLMDKRRVAAEAVVAEANARQSLADVAAGRFATDGRVTVRTPAEIARESIAATAERDELRASLAALSAPVPVASPCDCTVAQVGATGGAFVNAGDALLGLAERAVVGAATEVDTLVPANRVGFLRQGQAVRVHLAGARDAVPARIAAINLNPENTGRVGLPDNLRTLKAYALVTVTLDDPAPGTAAGLPGLLVAPVEMRSLLQAVPGLSWLVTEAGPAAARGAAITAGRGPATATGRRLA